MKAPQAATAGADRQTNERANRARLASSELASMVFIGYFHQVIGGHHKLLNIPCLLKVKSMRQKIIETRPLDS
eukprot:scaffold33174_cov71-Phaeocystis_antarctica.AAC.1